MKLKKIEWKKVGEVIIKLLIIWSFMVSLAVAGVLLLVQLMKAMSTVDAFWAVGVVEWNFCISLILVMMILVFNGDKIANWFIVMFKKREK